jgi:hypothetical protein
MSSPDRLDPLGFAGSFSYLESDVPPGITLQAWRSRRNRPAAAPRFPAVAGADADGAPHARTLRARMETRRPRSRRGPSPTRYR